MLKLQQYPLCLKDKGIPQFPNNKPIWVPGTPGSFSRDRGRRYSVGEREVSKAWLLGGFHRALGFSTCLADPRLAHICSLNKYWQCVYNIPEIVLGARDTTENLTMSVPWHWCECWHLEFLVSDVYQQSSENLSHNQQSGNVSPPWCVRNRLDCMYWRVLSQLATRRSHRRGGSVKKINK